MSAEAEAERVAAQAEAQKITNAEAAVAKDEAAEAVAVKVAVEEQVMAAKAAGMAAAAAAMADASRLSAKLKVISENAMCCMCLSEPKTHLLLPCGHKCVCKDCVTLLSSPGSICPLCRVDVASTVRVYES